MTIALLVMGMGLLPTTQALADGPCSAQAIAGHWVFATNVGRQLLGGPFPPGKDIAAIGTMNLDRFGNMSGKFDVTVQDFAFIPDIQYTGSVTVNPDCTGTVTFVTTLGTERTDSIVIVNQREMLGMSQNPFNLWNYQVRRISGEPAKDGGD
jgi:hypothetical protein